MNRFRAVLGSRMGNPASRLKGEQRWKRPKRRQRLSVSKEGSAKALLRGTITWESEEDVASIVANQSGE